MYEHFFSLKWAIYLKKIYLWVPFFRQFNLTKQIRAQVRAEANGPWALTFRMSIAYSI